MENIHRRPFVAAIAITASILLLPVTAAPTWAQESARAGEEERAEGAGDEEEGLDARARARPGDRVRVTREAGTVFVGDLGAVDADRLEVVTETGAITIPRDDVSRLEASRGHQRHPWLGMAVGGGAGLLWGLIVTSGDDINDPDHGGETALSAAVAGSGAFVGALGGLAIGSLIRTERWVEAAPPGAGLSLGPAPDGGVRMGLTLRF